MRKKIFLIFLVILVATAITLCLSLDRIFIYIFARSHNLDITYQKTPLPEGGLTYVDLFVFSRRAGTGLFSNLASFRPRWNGELVVGFNFKMVHFVERWPDKPPGASSVLDDLVAIPFGSHWIYKEISGEIIPCKDGVKIKDFTATSDDIRISLAGYFFNDHTVKADVVIYFSDKLAATIPGELSKVLLAKEEGGWNSLSVHFEGNLKTPSIQLSSKRFRLNIAPVVRPEKS